jgi:hypothetical protein
MNSNTNAKAVYVQPSLQRLGSISSLTAGGVGSVLEMMMMTNLMMRS